MQADLNAARMQTTIDKLLDYKETVVDNVSIYS